MLLLALWSNNNIQFLVDLFFFLLISLDSDKVLTKFAISALDQTLRNALQTYYGTVEHIVEGILLQGLQLIMLYAIL